MESHPSTRLPIHVNPNNYSLENYDENSLDSFEKPIINQHEIDLLPILIKKTRTTVDDLKKQCQAWVEVNYPYACSIPNDLECNVPERIWCPPKLEDLIETISISGNHKSSKSLKRNVSIIKKVSSIITENVDNLSEKHKPDKVKKTQSVTESVLSNSRPLFHANSSKNRNSIKQAKERRESRKLNPKVSKNEITVECDNDSTHITIDSKKAVSKFTNKHTRKE